MARGLRPAAAAQTVGISPTRQTGRPDSPGSCFLLRLRMARDLPYLTSYKNVGKLFDAIHSAKQPDTFTHQFLHNTLGMSSSGDRSFFPLLKNLGFLDSSNRPTPAYGTLKNSATRKGAITAAVRKAYAPLFEANERAETLPNDQLKGLVAQVA